MSIDEQLLDELGGCHTFSNGTQHHTFKLIAGRYSDGSIRITTNCMCKKASIGITSGNTAILNVDSGIDWKWVQDKREEDRLKEVFKPNGEPINE